MMRTITPSQIDIVSGDFTKTRKENPFGLDLENATLVITIGAETYHLIESDEFLNVATGEVVKIRME